MTQKIGATQLKRDILELTLSATTYFKLDTNWVSKKFVFDTSMSSIDSDDSLLSFDTTNKGVKIGKGVTRVRIESMINFYSESTSGDLATQIFKNNSSAGDGSYTSVVSTIQYQSSPGRPLYVDVAENDIIYLYLVGNTLTNRRYFNNTYLSVEVIG